MNALTAVQNNAVDSGQDYSGFTLIPSAQSPRLLELTFTEQTTKQFLEQVAEWPVQALEYKSFLRFRVGKILDDLCANQLQPLLLKTLLNRAEGALLINAVGVDDVKQADEMVKLATAVAHLIGRSNFDAMSGQYYARFGESLWWRDGGTMADWLLRTSLGSGRRSRNANPVPARRRSRLDLVVLSEILVFPFHIVFGGVLQTGFLLFG